MIASVNESLQGFEADALLDRLRAGDVRALARAISVVEDGADGAAELLAACRASGREALRIGVTGPPGAGKSTLVDQMVRQFRARGKTVGVVAVDPSSPFTGGAILGDRIRMRDRFLDEGVFIRSMASRGHAGGLSRATMRVVNVLDALGTGLVIVETIGVGQEEVDVMRVADTVCLVTVPGLGDDIQAIKAGILEIADVLVVNKADKPGADETIRDLAQMLSLGKGRTQWKPPIIRTSAQEDTGIDALVKAIDAHVEWSTSSGDRDVRRAGAARQEVEALLREALVKRLEDRIGHQRVTDAVARVAKRELDPYRAVDELLADR